MHPKKRKIFILVGFVIVFALGCDKFKNLQLAPKKKMVQPQGMVIARVGDLPITLEQLEQEINNYNELIGSPEARLTTREQKIAYLNEELVRRHLFYLEAKARRIEEQPKAQELLQNLEINVLANQLMQDEIGNITVTSSEIEDFYNLYKEQYRQDEERRVREIVLDTEQEAKDVLIELLKGTDFASVASQRSRAASAGNGGDLGFIKKGSRGADFSRFDEVAFSRSLEAGQISNIFKGKDGFYIIKVEGVKGGQAKSLSEVWDEINKSVLFLKQQQKLQEITGRLLKNTKVVVYEDKVK